MSKKYSVVIPVFNSEKIIYETVSRTIEFFTSKNLEFEIILINDGSPDNSWNIISDLASKHEKVIAIDLLKNYGQHNANLCGFREATGDYIITMDDDLQNPPEEIAKLIQAAGDSFDLVIGRFEVKKHTFFRRIGSRIVSKINQKVFNIEPNFTLTNFRLIRHDVIKRVCRDRSATPYIPGLVLKFSNKRCNTTVRHQPRHSGKSNYTLRKIFNLTATILFNYSTIPLRFGAAFGFIVSGISFFLGLYYLCHALIVGSNTPGWPTLVVLISFFNGVLIMLLSVIGEYLIRVLREIGNQQSYEISEVVGR
jgi:polyisoprenyl-phosphate glycosyltransferase